MQKERVLKILVLAIFFVLCGCGGSDYGDKAEQPKGEPKFPRIVYWIMDEEGALKKRTVQTGDRILHQLRADGIAEVVVLVKKGIKNPDKYATHYGRWLKLGKTGRSSGGGNNGIVWVIRPDAEPRMTISVGRGLPKFTAADYEQIMLAAKDDLYSNKFDEGVKKIVEGTDRALREIYRK